ncbi:DUF4367 domain-containing protein [Evansella sp. AB-rgal1]
MERNRDKNNSGFIFQKKNMIQWVDEGVTYRLDGGDLHEEELFQIAEY